MMPETRGNSVVVNAGREAAIAISKAQAAIHDVLGDVIRRDLDQLQSEVGTTELKTYADLTALTKRLRSIVQSLPFRQHQPELRNVLPASGI